MSKKGFASRGLSIAVGGIAGMAAIATGGYVAGEKFLENVVHPNTIDYKEHYYFELQKGRFSESWFHELEKEEIYIKSVYGYNIHGFYFNNRSHHTIILIHGITSSMWASVQYIEMFYNRGYNVLIYDQRNHGQSEGRFTTMGAFEQIDAKTVVEYAKKKSGKGVVGLHGVSMGAATALMTAALTPYVDFVIEDCGYTSTIDELSYRLKEDYQLPPFPFVQIAEAIARKKYGFDFHSYSPLKAVKQMEIPVLFLHGDKDTFVPYNMVHALYRAKKGKKEFHGFKDSIHATSYSDHKREYKEVVYAFLDKYGFN